MSVNRKRHLLKALTYRLLGSGFTAIMALILTGSLTIGGILGV